MAATYIEDGSVVVIKRQHNASQGEVVLQKFRGREEIEKGYADIFKERPPEYRSRNIVDFARYLGPHLLLIQGRSRHSTATRATRSSSYRFAHVGDDWKIVSMQLAPLAKDDPWISLGGEQRCAVTPGNSV